jgi:hypothetical protein
VGESIEMYVLDTDHISLFNGGGAEGATNSGQTCSFPEEDEICVVTVITTKKNKSKAETKAFMRQKQREILHLDA